MNEQQEAQLISKDLQLQLAKGELDWNDEKVQFFLPVILAPVDFDWLELIAENTLIEEDEKVVKNFLAMVKSLSEINLNNLENAIFTKMSNMFGDLDD